MMAIKLEMLRVFRVVAEQGSLTAAAETLNRTPSAVSMMLSQLTGQVGAPLFETDRKNRLTPLGRLVLDESNRATDAFDRCTDAIQRHVLSTAGTVRLASVPSAAVSLLPRIIAEFHRDRPDIRIEISDVDSAEVRRRIHFDEADIGILSAAPSDTCQEDVILQDSLGIVYHCDGIIARQLRDGQKTGKGKTSKLASGVKEAGKLKEDAEAIGTGKTRTQRKPAGWELLLLEPLIANPLCDRVDHPQVRSHLAGCTLQARNTSALLSCVQNGLGATVLPFNAITQGMDKIAFIQPENPVTYRVLQRIRSDERHLSPVAEAFWQALSPPLPIQALHETSVSSQ